MAIPMGVIRLVATGTLASGENFAFGLWISHALTGGQTELDSIATAWGGAISASTGTIWQTYNTPDAVITEISAYAYTTTSGEATVVSHVPVSIAGGASTTTELPLQCAYVISTRCAVNGRRFRGRFYVPLTSVTLTNHQLTTAQCTSILTGWQTAINVLATAVPPLEPVVVSNTGSVATPITEISMDTRVDIQRRRANRQAIIGAVTKTIA